MRDESTEKNNPLLTRIEIIQKEIDEIRNREREYRKIHANEFGDLVDIDDDVDEEEQQEDSLENNGHGHELDHLRNDEKSSSDGGLSSTPSTSNSISDLSYQKPLDVTHRQPSLNTINLINSNVSAGGGGRHLLRSPVSPVSGSAFQPRVFVPNQKGLMQKFIISHGKIGNSERNGFNTSNGIHHADYVTSAIELSEPGPRAPIERDELGRPLRKGYVPVKDKIQQELQDLESREAELKVLRKSLVQEINRQDEQHAKTNGHNNKNVNAVIVQADVKSNNCDKTTLLKELNEVPSSTKLIEQWENLIKEKEQQRQKTL